MAKTARLNHKAEEALKVILQHLREIRPDMEPTIADALAYAIHETAKTISHPPEYPPTQKD